MVDNPLQEKMAHLSLPFYAFSQKIEESLERL
jgi:hypothetical protein